MADETTNTPVDPFADVRTALGGVQTNRSGVENSRDTVAAAQQALTDAQAGEASSVEQLDLAQQKFDEQVKALRAGAPDGSYWSKQAGGEGPA